MGGDVRPRGAALAVPEEAETAQWVALAQEPAGAWAANDTMVDIADSPREDWYGPDYLCFTWRRYRNRTAQWLGLQLEQRGLTTPVASFLNQLWFDPTLDPVSPAQLPTMRWFADRGIVLSRSDWSGEVQLGFPSDPGFGHVHPDANHFVVVGGGHWLIEDDGYAWKETAQDNTLLVDGIGQDGENEQYFTRKTPLPASEEKVLMAESYPEFDVLAGEAAPDLKRDGVSADSG